jgi:hypothetical protein
MLSIKMDLLASPNVTSIRAARITPLPKLALLLNLASIRVTCITYNLHPGLAQHLVRIPVSPPRERSEALGRT